jgi:hypothetical protein
MEYDNAFTYSYVPELRVHVQRNYTSPPRDSDPTDRQVKDLGTPEGMMNCHFNLALILLIYILYE